MNQHKTVSLGKIIFLTVAILIIVASITSVTPVFAQVTPANFDAVDDYISTEMKELGIPGAALVVVQGNEIVHLKAFGVADGSGRLVTPQTPFFTGSTGYNDLQRAQQPIQCGRVYRSGTDRASHRRQRQWELVERNMP